ncbi:MAG: DUF58 domain-containing protein [Planctomycetes bacterium]|nr:DUF58 domain-containing protein [Planctomycetota bacterium]
MAIEGRPGFSRRSGFVLAVLALGATGLRFGVSLLVVLALALGLLLAFAFLLTRLLLRNVSCGRRVYHGAFEQEEIDVKLLLRNHGRLPIYLPVVCDVFAPDQFAHRRVLLPSRAAGRNQHFVHYTGHCFRRRGVYKLGPMKVELSDPLGLFTAVREFDVPMDFLVYPRTAPIRPLALAGRRPIFTSGHDTVASPGLGDLYMGTREFRQGDEIRRIHWNASARWGRLIVKEFEKDVTQEVTIFLDLDQRNARGIGQRSTIEIAIRVAASLAMTAVRAHAHVQLAGLGSRYHYVPLGTGEAHLIRLLDQMVPIRQDGETHFGDFLHFARDLVRPGSTVCLLFSTTDLALDKYAAVFDHLRSRAPRVLAFVLDDRSFVQWRERISDDQVSRFDPERARALLESQGFEVQVLSAEEDLDEQLLLREERERR